MNLSQSGEEQIRGVPGLLLPVLASAASALLVTALSIALTWLFGARTPFGLTATSIVFQNALGFSLMMALASVLICLLPKGSWRRHATALGLAILMIVANHSNLTGPWIRSHRAYVAIAFALDAILAVSSFAWCILCDRIRGSGTRGRIGILLICAVLATLDLTVLPGRYPGLRWQFAILANGMAFFVALQVVMGLRGPRLNVVGGLALALASTLIGIAVSQRSSATYPAEIESAARIAGPVRIVFPWTERWFSFLWPLPTSTDSANDSLESRDFTQEETPPEFMINGRERWNLLIVSIDTVRADSVGFMRHGSERPLRSPSPAWDEFAESALVFENAYTSYPTSNYAYASLFSGLHPRLLPLSEDRRARRSTFPDGVRLAQILKHRGFQTAALTAAPKSWFEEENLFLWIAPGFDVIRGAEDDAQPRADEVISIASGIIRSFRSNQFFLWIHLMDPHAPYEGPGFEGKGTPEDRYLGDIARADAGLAALLQDLDRQKLLDQTLIVVHSDHGEALGQRGVQTHNSNLHEEQVRVPLTIRLPGVQGRRVAQICSLTDILPTVLSALGVSDDLPRTGRSLLSKTGKERGEIPVVAELFSEGGNFTPYQAIWFDHFKLIRRMDLPAIQVFDLLEDPSETRNVFGSDRDRDSTLLNALAKENATIEAAGEALRRGETSSIASTSLQTLRGYSSRLATIQSSAPGQVSELVLLMEETLFAPHMALRASFGDADSRAEAEALVDTLVKNRARLETQARLALDRMIGGLARVSLVPFLRERWQEDRNTTTLLALSMLGDQTGADVFRQALHAEDESFPHPAAIALQNLGIREGKDELIQALRDGSGTLAAAACAALAVHPDEDGLAMLRARIWANANLSEDEALTASKALLRDQSEEATACLVRLWRKHGPAVGRLIKPVLTDRLGSERLASEARTDSQLETAELQLKDGQYQQAALGLLDAVARNTLSQRRLSGLLMEANQAVREMETDGPGSLLLRASNLNAEVQVVRMTRGPGPMPMHRIVARIRNGGSVPWRGHPGPFRCWLSVQALDKDGAPIADAFPLKTVKHWLKDPVVESGAEILVELYGRWPSEPPPARLELRFHQEAGPLLAGAVLLAF